MDLGALKILLRYPSPKPGARKALLFTNCTGRGLSEYLLTSKDFANQYHLFFIETAPMVMAEHKGHDIMGSEEMQSLIADCDVFIGHNLGARHGSKALFNMICQMKDSVKVVTFVAPNFSALWPFAHGYGGDIGVHCMLDEGASRDDVWKAFKNGTFKPLFNVRWRVEMGRIGSMEQYHDVGFSEFMTRNLRRAKMFMAISHPSGHIVAHLGSGILKKLGIEPEPEEANLSRDCKTFAINGQPETNYEFAYYKFSYPMRFTEGSDRYYSELLDQSVAWWKSGGLIHKMDA